MMYKNKILLIYNKNNKIKNKQKFNNKNKN